MSEPKTECKKCGVPIQFATADRTGGLCMPCKTGRPRPPDPNKPLTVSCEIEASGGSRMVFFAIAQELLRRLEGVRHVGDDSHPNKIELEAQRALLRHAIRYHVKIRLNDDHWAQTSSLLTRLFEEGLATMQIGDRGYRFSEITKEEWREGTQPLAMNGGFLYRDVNGNEIYRRMTWIS